MKQGLWAALAVGLIAASWAGSANDAAAQQGSPYPQYPSYQLNRWFHYPHYYFPHNYWPVQGPRWPEAPGAPYMRPPAYQAYPAFREPGWRYDLWQSMPYYKGFHYWLDQF